MPARKPRYPRPEYPRPQFEREGWINLNGPWSYTFDFGRSGMERGFPASRGFDNEILVPFCPESPLSGVGHRDFIDCMWYHRHIKIPKGWDGKKILLHFGGVDYECEAFIDGESAGKHWGGSVSFSFDVSSLVEAGGSHDLVLYVRDDTRSGNQPGGKQSPEFRYRKMGCHYTRTTGIWQTVWMEAVHPRGLREVYTVSDIDGGRFLVTPRYHGVARGNQFLVRVLEDRHTVSEARCFAVDGLGLELALEKPKLWSPEDPFLYDLELEVMDGQGNVLDAVKSYAGMRKVHIQGNTFFLNNEPVYLRLVLDQGFYPDGVWTAPSDDALKRDIQLSMHAGFNGARLHQKVFEERFHYWADRLGYITWGESPSWGLGSPREMGPRNFLSEWREILVRDRNHPSIIAWTPLNETGAAAQSPREHYRFHADLYELTHTLDPTRPVNDTSGYTHVRTDLWTVHDYKQDPKELARILTPTPDGGVYRYNAQWEPPYEGQPYLVDEFGGIKWIGKDRKAYMATSWGYGDAPKTEEGFYRRLEGLVGAILSHKHICGYCYTQLTDVEQEQNGIYYFDRTEKFDMKRIASIFGKTPS
jgi:beta-galactosidase/beta-glucuronidase